VLTHFRGFDRLESTTKMAELHDFGQYFETTDIETQIPQINI